MTWNTFAGQDPRGVRGHGWHNRRVPNDFRLAPQFAARLLGLTLMGAGLAIVVATVVAVGFITQPWLVSLTVAVALAVILFVIWKLRAGTWVVRLTDDGYKAVSYTHLTLPTNREV